MSKIVKVQRTGAVRYCQSAGQAPEFANMQASP